MAAGAVTDPYIRFRNDFHALLDQRCYTPEWLDAQVWAGAFRVFGDDDGCILVSLKRYPTGLYEIHGEAAAGDLAAIKRLIERAVEWGRSVGCQLASIASRSGWVRALKDDGWVIHQTELRKEL